MDWDVELSPQGELSPRHGRPTRDDVEGGMLRIQWPNASSAVSALEVAVQTIELVFLDAIQYGIKQVEFVLVPSSLVCALAEPLCNTGFSFLSLFKAQVGQSTIDALAPFIKTLGTLIISHLDYVPVLPMKEDSELTIMGLRASSLPSGCWWCNAGTVAVLDAPHLTRIDAMSNGLRCLNLSLAPSLLQVTTSATDVRIFNAPALVELTATRSLTHLDVWAAAALARVNLRSGFGASPTVSLIDTGTLCLPWTDSIFDGVYIDTFDVPGICVDFSGLAEHWSDSLAKWASNLGVQPGTRDQCIAAMRQRVNRRINAMILIIAGRRRARALARALPRELWDLVFYEFLFQ